MDDKPGAGYRILVAVIPPWLRLWFDLSIEGDAHLPRQGPAIVAANHLSYLDPLAVAHAVHAAGRHGRFLAKQELFAVPVVGWFMRSAGHIPVRRGSPDAPVSLARAEEALRNGGMLIVFPEGTTSVDPSLKPARPKTGVARLALATGAPVIPCATWGGQWFWTKHMRRDVRPGKQVWMKFGPPVDLGRFSGGPPPGPGTWRDAAQAVMDDITRLLDELRPLKPWTPLPLRPGYLRKRAKAKPPAGTPAT